LFHNTGNSVIEQPRSTHVPSLGAGILGALLVLAAALSCLTFEQRQLTWSDDGFTYTRMMLEDAGKPPAEALKIAESYYRASPIGHLANYAQYYSVSYHDSPRAAGPIFRSRVLYPWLAAQLYPQRGLLALVDVSMISFIIAVFALYYLLLAVARPLLAAVFALPLCLSPAIVEIAKAPLTDMLGLVLWIVALACCFHYLKLRRPVYPALFAITCLLMALTRPMLYLPLGATAGLAIASGLHRDRLNIRAGTMLFVITAVAIAFQLMVVRAVQGAPLLLSIQVAHANALRRGAISVGEPLSNWYKRTVIGMLVIEAKHSLRALVPGFAVIAAFLNRHLDETGLVVGAAIVSITPVFLDPNPYDLVRLVEAPMYPVILVSIATTVERLLVSRSAA
jgi:hypothetical protein